MNKMMSKSADYFCACFNINHHKQKWIQHKIELLKQNQLQNKGRNLSYYVHTNKEKVSWSTMEMYLSWVYSLRYFNRTEFMIGLKINVFSLNRILNRIEANNHSKNSEK